MSGRCFTLGILSTLDAFLDETLDSIITAMGLSAELNDALLARRGTLGLILATVLAFETAAWTQVPWPQLAALGVNQQLAEEAYLESLRWVSEALGRDGSKMFD